MKYDLNKKPTLGAKRTLLNIRNTFGTLLSEKSFDSIQVIEICERSMIPKSTFYNYFDDKYDLLRYFFESYESEINANIHTPSEKPFNFTEALNSLLDFTEKHLPYMERIFKNNPPAGYCYQEFLNFLISACIRTMERADAETPEGLPPEIVLKMRAHAVLTVLEWVYFQHHPLSREEIISYIYQLSYVNA